MKPLIISLFAFCIIFSSQNVEARRGYRSCCLTTQYCPCVTLISAGDLNLRISGDNRDTLEIYYGEVEFCRYIFPAGTQLCSDNLIVAPKNSAFGAFVVRYSNKLSLFGRIPKTEKWTTTILEFPENEPISLEWISSRILRIQHGSEMKQTMVIRVDEANDSWKRLSPNPAPIGSVKKWNPNTLGWE